MNYENKTIAVLTTINDPNEKIGDWFDITKNKTIVVGDNKTPKLESPVGVLIESKDSVLELR